MEQEYLKNFIEKYINKTSSSRNWAQKYRQHMADSRASAGFRFSVKEMLYPIVASKGQGAYFFDIDDNKYVDIAMGYGTLLFGHCYTPIMESIKRQIEEGPQLGPQNNKAGEVADLITEITGTERIAFCNSGTEANMTAIRLARLATGKNKIVVFQDSYHGFYDGTLVAPTENLGIPKPLFEGFPQSLIEDIIILPYGSLESVEALNQFKDNLAGVIVEPVRSRFPEVQPKEFLKGLREATTRLGAVLIFDEVITGFRCHMRGAQAYFGIEADLVTYGKIIGGGLPLGIVAGKKSYMDGIDGGYWQYNDKSFPVVPTTFFGGTFFKNPLSIAAAYAVITEIKKTGPELQNSLNKKTEELAREINKYCDNFNLPVETVFFSSLFRFKCKGNLDIFFYHLLYKGLYVWEGRNFFLSQAHSLQDINFIKDAVLESLDDLRKANIIAKKKPGEEKSLPTYSPTASIALNLKTFPTTSEQKSVWLLSQLQQAGNTAYNEVVLINLKGKLNKDALRQALQKLVMRHEALRMQFSEDGEYITFLDNLDVNLKVLNYEEDSFPRTIEELKALIKSQVDKPFSLEEAPLFSFYLLRFSDTQHVLLVSAHHTIMDGQSSDIFLKDLFLIYEGIANKESVIPLNMPIQFSKFIKEKILNSHIEESKEHWSRILRPPIEPLIFQSGKVRPALKTFEGGHYTFFIKKELKEKLKGFARAHHSTLFMTILAAINILIYKYTNQKDFIIGVPASNKNSSEFENTIGFSTIVYPIRVPIDAYMDFKNYLIKVRNSIFAIHDYPDFDASSLIKELNIGWDQGRSSPIFDVLLNMEAETDLPKCSNLDLEIIALHSPFKTLNLDFFNQKPIYLESGKAKFDLAFNFLDCREELIGAIEFSKDVFDEKTIEKMAQHFEILLEEILEKPGPIVNLSLLTCNEKNQILIEWNNTQKQYAEDKTIHQLFEEQVRKTPQNIAVVFEDVQLTYIELNEKANKLAHYLIHRGIQPDTLVAIISERSLEMIVGILAILKAGAAYVPLDPEYPQERLTYILQDTNISLILAQSHLSTKLVFTNAEILFFDQDKFVDFPTSNPSLPIQSNQLAYVIYTSGSTGKPKGVLNIHKGAVNRLLWMKDYCQVQEDDCLLQKTPYTFDVSVWELFLGLISGAQLIFAKPEGHKDPFYLNNLIKSNKITLIHFVPSMLETFLLSANISDCASLKKVITSGEALSLNLKNRFFSIFPQIELHNLYGPTEASIDVSFWDCSSNKTLQLVPIGKPIWNTSLYILDEALNPLPIGLVGEIYIGGIGLARGYLNQPHLTAEKFIENPFVSDQDKAEQKNTRLYKTGDLGRWLEDGNIEYLGRIDDQIKLRGYRIELGEIESALNQYINVVRSVVLVQEYSANKDDRFLIAYLAIEQERAESLGLKLRKEDSTQKCFMWEGDNINKIIEDIKSYLSGFLPDYMVPSYYVLLNEIPLTHNGKVNKKYLQTLVTQLQGSKQDYTPPQTEIENNLSEIWSEVLGIDKIGIYDNFFKMGGHSLLATKLIMHIRTHFKVNLQLKDLFDSPTIAALASTIENFSQDLSESISPILPVNEASPLPLSFAQERLWFIERYAEGTNAYNIPGAFRIQKNVRIDILELSIKAIISRHEILRTLIKEGDRGNSYQVVVDDKEKPFEIEKITTTSYSQLDLELRKLANHIYDLSEEYPIKVCLYKVDTTNLKENIENYLGIVVHHIAFDGWSIDIFLKELQIYYYHYIDKLKGIETTLRLPTLGIQYRDFAVWQRKYLTGKKLEEQLNYWKNKLEDYKTLNLITDKPRPSKVTYEGAYTYFTLDNDISIALRELAKELNISLYSLLLAGYYLMLRVYSNQDDIVVGTPIANRHYHQIENLIGFFVNSLALRTKINPNITLTNFIKQVWQEVVEAQSYQDLPFEKLVEELELEKDTSRHPIFQAQFGVQNFGSLIQTQASGLSNPTNLLQPYIIEGRLYNVAQFDLSTFIDDSQIRLTGSFNYATSIFSKTTVTRFIETYILILKQIAELVHNKQKQETYKITNLKYLNEDQYNQIINVWNQTDKLYPSDKTIQALFEEQVLHTPDNIAVTYGEIKLTYLQLNEISNQLANYLKESYNITPNTFVGLCLDRNEYMLIGILAILKAGGTYVPIDPNYPNERIEYILSDADIGLILTNEIYKERLGSISQTKVLAIDNISIQECLKNQPITNPHTVTKSSDLAYVIYTSGTTGKPKGILMPHQVISKLVAWEKSYSFSLTLKVAQFASISFDVSLQEISFAILNGHQLVIIPEDVKLSFDKLVPFIDSQQINRLYFPSTALGVLSEKILTQGLPLKNLTTLIVSGEELIITPYISTYFKQRPWVELINHYGPSETHLVTSYNLPRLIDEWPFAPPIGKAIDNTKLYVLDNNLTPLPIGAIGELYITGVGLAHGYINKAELTKEKFIDNPFQSSLEKTQEKYERLYKTGDLVRWLQDSNLEYVGRNDHQVKIRGFRVELDEIENVLLSFEGVKQAVVLVKEHLAANKVSSSGNKYLVGYYITENKLNEIDLLKYLQSRLPEYMVPNILVHLKSLPLTINGKLDRKALPEPDFNNVDSYIKPRNELEKNICKIWSEVLGLPEDKIGIQDDFFRLGGNSILAIRLISIINSHYQSHLKISDIFVYKTIESLLPRIVQTKDSYQTIVKLNNTYDKPNMFMIHPGEAGCEVYTSLAHKLSDNFSCYGIDSYNLYHDNKIDNLHDLAKYYLSYIEEIMTKTNQDIYHLLGWSLGGVLSLEIAGLLEKSGKNKIKVYLLDAILEDEHLSALMDTINLEEVKEAYKTYKISRGYDELYIEKIISLVSIEKYLIRIPQISSTLVKTKALLFKAMLQDTSDVSFKTSKASEIHHHIHTLEYNNVDKIFKNKSSIKLIRIEDTYHGNILDREDLITSEIKLWDAIAKKQEVIK